MARGFALSIDALLSVIILSLFISAIYFFSSQTSNNQHNPLLLKKQADDLLIMLDNSGDLSTLNSTVIGQSINSSIYPSLDWNMELRSYNYSSGFVEDTNTTFGSNYSSIENLVLSQREFLIFQNNSIQHYAIARLRLWLK